MAKAKIDPVIAMQIINFTATNTGNHGGSSNYETHNIDVATTGAYLPYSDSTVVYEIELINLGTDPNGIFAVTGLPSNLQYSFSGYTEQDKICDANNSSNCGKLARRTITMTISYKQNGYNSGTTTYPLTLNFDFRAFHSITYSGFSGSYRDYVIDGGNLNVTFGNNDIPSTVGVTGSTYSYTSPTLSLTSVSSNVTVTKKYNVTYSGFTGSTSGLPSSIVYSGGTITFDNTSGIPSGVTVTGATGSYTSPTLTISNITSNITITASSGGGMGTPDDPYEDSTTTTYDPSDVPPNSTIVYTAVSGSPQVSSDANGKIISYEYTNTGSNGVSVGNGVDTGIIAFDGNNFDIHLKATFTYSRFPSSGMAPVINLSSYNNNKVDGILLGGAINSSGTTYNETGTSVSCKTSSKCAKFRLNKYENGSVTTGIDYYHKQPTAFYSYRFSSRSTTFTISIRIHYSNNKFTSEIYYNDDYTAPIAKLKYNTSNQATDTALDFSQLSNDITIELGKYKDGTTFLFDIIEFSAVKS